MERVIDVTTARRQLGTLLDEVFYKGEIITIERKGKPLAQIIPQCTIYNTLAMCLKTPGCSTQVSFLLL